MVGGTGKNAPRTIVIFIARPALRLGPAKANRPLDRSQSVARNNFSHFVALFRVPLVSCRSSVAANALFQRDRLIQHSRRDPRRSRARCLRDSKLKRKLRRRVLLPP